MAERIDIGFESLLRDTLKAEAASIPLSIGPEDVLRRRRVRGSTLALPRLGLGTRSLKLAAAVVLAAVAAFAVWQGGLPSLIPAASPSPVPTPSPFTGPAPAGTPSAGAIAHLVDGRIQLVDPTTGASRSLTPALTDLVADHVGIDCVLEPTADRALSDMDWAPDGRALAFGVTHSCGHTVFAVSADGRTTRILLDDSDFNRSPLGGRSQFYRFGWSPNGSQLAITGQTSGQAAIPKLRVLSLDGSEPVDLGTACAECSFDPIPGAHWSPDGTMLAARFTGSQDGDRHWIAVVDVRTGTWTTLWAAAADFLMIPLQNAWLPDGRLVIEADGGWFAVDPRNPQARTVLRAMVVGGMVLISPDGSRTAYRHDGRRRQYGQRLIVVDMATGDETQIADWLLFGNPAWSPDSSEIAAVLADDLGRRGGLWVAGADGSNARQVVPRAGDMLAWQPVWP